MVLLVGTVGRKQRKIGVGGLFGTLGYLKCKVWGYFLRKKSTVDYRAAEREHVHCKTDVSAAAITLSCIARYYSDLQCIKMSCTVLTGILQNIKV